MSLPALTVASLSKKPVRRSSSPRCTRWCYSLNRTTATRIMLEVHTKGKGVCGVFTYEIAETKVAQVTTYARDQQHPLMCTLEEA